MKNIWSLQVGEAIVAEEIKKKLSKDYEVFIPLNNQLKDIDLIISNLKTKNFKTIQVKESREYDRGKANGWFRISDNHLNNFNFVDFYVFLIYSTRQTKTKDENQIYFIIVPSKDLLKKSLHKKPTVDKKSNKKTYHYYFHITDGNVLEVRDKPEVDYSIYLNNFEILK